jgi:hypothetical protein
MDVQIVFPGEQPRTNLVRSKNQGNYLGLVEDLAAGAPNRAAITGASVFHGFRDTPAATTAGQLRARLGT